MHAQLVHQLRAVVPEPGLDVLIRARLKLAWRRPEYRRQAEEQLAVLLDASPRAHEIPALAHRYAEFSMRRSELRWHPRLITRQPVENPEVLRNRRKGQGLVLSFMHQGYYEGLSASVRGHAGPIHSVAAPSFFHHDPEPWQRRLVSTAALGGPVISSDLGATRLAELLTTGATVAIASDFKGQTPVTFLGKRFVAASGAARIACMANSPVVVVTSRRGADGNPILSLSEPLHPAEFDGAQSLLDQILRLHEPAILAWPEAVDRPLDLWQPA